MENLFTYIFIIFQGSKLGGCQDPRALLNSPSAPSNFCREPKDVLFAIHSTFMKLMKMQLGSLDFFLISSPVFSLRLIMR